MKHSTLLAQRRFWVVAAMVLLAPISLATGQRLVVVVITAWLVYRLYKFVGRRCHCGRFDVERIHKIQMARDESISIVVYRDGKKHFRWWIRRVRTLTFTVCACGWKELVKESRDKISVAHAWWVWFTDRAQYFDDSELLTVFDKAARDGRSSEFLSKHQEHDTPPLPLLSSLWTKTAGFFARLRGWYK